MFDDLTTVEDFVNHIDCNFVAIYSAFDKNIRKTQLKDIKQFWRRDGINGRLMCMDLHYGGPRMLGFIFENVTEYRIDEVLEELNYKLSVIQLLMV